MIVCSHPLWLAKGRLADCCSTELTIFFPWWNLPLIRTFLFTLLRLKYFTNQQCRVVAIWAKPDTKQQETLGSPHECSLLLFYWRVKILITYSWSMSKKMSSCFPRIEGSFSAKLSTNSDSNKAHFPYRLRISKTFCNRVSYSSYWAFR